MPTRRPSMRPDGLLTPDNLVPLSAADALERPEYWPWLEVRSVGPLLSPSQAGAASAVTDFSRGGVLMLVLNIGLRTPFDC
jgi:hypothetical protein